MSGYSADNIEITIANTNTAVIATDYGTSGDGFTLAHAQISKIAWGDTNNTYRVNQVTPLPIQIQGITSTTVPVTGTVSGTGDFFVRTNPTIPLIIKGSTFTADAPVSILGGVFGVSGGTAIRVTGGVSIVNSIGIFGISGATAIGITGGRRLNSSTDSVTIVGNVGLSGGLALVAATNSVSVFGPGGSTWIHSNIYSGDVAIGRSGDALKVAVTNSGFTFSVNVAATVGVTNDTSSSALRVQGLSGGIPLTIRGSLAGGAVEIGAVSPVPVSVSGTVTVDDADIISEINSLKTNIGEVSTNAGYALDVLNLITPAGSGAKVNVASITKPPRIAHGQKSLTTTPAPVGNDTFRVGVTLKSPASNGTEIYIGNSVSVSATNGYILSPGETIYLEISSTSSLFARTAAGTATLAYIGS